MYTRVEIDAEKGSSLLEEAENEQSNQVKECKNQNFIGTHSFIREYRYLGRNLFKSCKTTLNLWMVIFDSSLTDFL